ncbi:MAG: hypothetical protein M1828_005614 [Chrysothrix sp. TS-e1954]|nr:MAG: hypothetical protein M1828_005614 [Chrysothrix sp. TS-e1954]
MSASHPGLADNAASTTRAVDIDASPNEHQSSAKAVVGGSYRGFVAGIFSGFSKLAVGHPFDTIKVRLQTSGKGQFSGPVDCVLRTARNEGVAGFYKGATPPLMGWMFMDSLLMGSLTLYRRLLNEHVFNRGVPEAGSRAATTPADRTQLGVPKLPAVGHGFAGMLAGTTVSFIAAPIEHVKARLQIQYAQNKTERLYTGPIDCSKKLLRNHGIRGLYHGLGATVFFRSFFFFWWSSYDIITRALLDRTHLSTPAVNFWAGGLSAQIYWLASYPSDVVKQRIMTDPLGEGRRFKRWGDAARCVYGEGGWRGFWRGFTPCALRAFPANAVALTRQEPSGAVDNASEDAAGMDTPPSMQAERSAQGADKKGFEASVQEIRDDEEEEREEAVPLSRQRANTDETSSAGVEPGSTSLGAEGSSGVESSGVDVEQQRASQDATHQPSTVDHPDTSGNQPTSTMYFLQSKVGMDETRQPPSSSFAVTWRNILGSVNQRLQRPGQPNDGGTALLDGNQNTSEEIDLPQYDQARGEESPSPTLQQTPNRIPFEGSEPRDIQFTHESNLRRQRRRERRSEIEPSEESNVYEQRRRSEVLWREEQLATSSDLRALQSRYGTPEDEESFGPNFTEHENVADESMDRVSRSSSRSTVRYVGPSAGTWNAFDGERRAVQDTNRRDDPVEDEDDPDDDMPAGYLPARQLHARLVGDATAEQRPSVYVDPLREQGQYWARGLDPWDDERFETIYGGYGGEARIRRRRADGGYPHPQQSSVPLHLQLLEHDAQGRSHIKSRHPAPAPAPDPSISTSAPQPDISRPFGLDGANDEEDLFDGEDYSRSFDDDPIFESIVQAERGEFGSDGHILKGTGKSSYNLNGLTMPIAHNVQRQAPSPSNSQQGQQTNGLANGGAGTSASLQNNVTHAGHQTDINFLWGVVQELSEILQQNRAQTADIVGSVQQIQARAREQGEEPSLEHVNGELSHAVNPADMIELQNRLHASQRQNAQLAHENDSTTKILVDYENSLAGLMDKLRYYAYEHTVALVATHKHYNALIEQEREANVQLRVEHGQWQQGLGRATEFARRALRERTEETSGLEAGLKEVKSENRVLRRLVGWRVEDDSDDEESPGQRESLKSKQAGEGLMMNQQGNGAQMPAY